MNKYQVIWLIIRLAGVYFAYLALAAFLGVVGSIPALANWNTGGAIPLSPAAYPTWRGTVNIPPGTAFEYKFIKKDGSNVVWETGSNRTYTAPSTPCTATIPATAFRT